MFGNQLAATRFDEALMDYSRQRMGAILPSDRLAHYTSSETALSIIRGDANGRRSLWLHNSQSMNDFSEVQFGQQCLKAALDDHSIAKRFKLICDIIDPTLCYEVIDAINQEWNDLGGNAFLLSLSLHNYLESRMGKLSMWRAYGGEEPVCFVLHTLPFLTYQSAYEMILSPVMYGTTFDYKMQFEALLHRLGQNTAMYRSIVPEGAVKAGIKMALDSSVLSMKTIGFAEENEWRLIHQCGGRRPAPPSIPDPKEPSKLVYQVPLHNVPEHNVFGAELDEAVERIIVGPSKNEERTRDELIAELEAAHLSNAPERVLLSDIPYRRKG